MITAARHWIIQNKKKRSLVNDIMLRMDEGILKILIFRKMADVEIQSFLFDQNLTHIFGYKNKIIVQKTILRPSRGQLYIKEVRKISN